MIVYEHDSIVQHIMVEAAEHDEINTLVVSAHLAEIQKGVDADPTRMAMLRRLILKLKERHQC